MAPGPGALREQEARRVPPHGPLLPPRVRPGEDDRGAVSAARGEVRKAHRPALLVHQVVEEGAASLRGQSASEGTDPARRGPQVPQGARREVPRRGIRLHADAHRAGEVVRRARRRGGGARALPRRVRLQGPQGGPEGERGDAGPDRGLPRLPLHRAGLQDCGGEEVVRRAAEAQARREAARAHGEVRREDEGAVRMDAAAQVPARDRLRRRTARARRSR